MPAYTLIVQIVYFIALLAVRPKHVTFTDEFNKRLLYMTAVHLPILLYGLRCHT